MASAAIIWDYLIVTAANERQAEAYEGQLRRRKGSDALTVVHHCLVIADLNGERMGSGGSTLHCLNMVLQHQQQGGMSFSEAEAILSGLRILIIHAGGDSRRLPAYSHCGKMFVPVPSARGNSTTTTLFDRLLPTFLALPSAGKGEVVVAAGDALLLMEASAVDLTRRGITAAGCLAPPEEAALHGVFCADVDGVVRRFLQKPSPERQKVAGAIDRSGRSMLDVGLMSFDAESAVQLMRTFFIEGTNGSGSQELIWKDGVWQHLLHHGIDLYREISCALGSEVTADQYLEAVRESGSTLDSSALAELFADLRCIPFRVEVLPRCKFLHFGTTRQLISSGCALIAADRGEVGACDLVLNSAVKVNVVASDCWIEGCSLSSEVSLGGLNALIGLDVTKPLALRRGACLDVSSGSGRNGESILFLRVCDIDDSFKQSLAGGGSFCGRPMQAWLDAVGIVWADVWPQDVSVSQRTLWNARVFPAIVDQSEYYDWLWLLDPEAATESQKRRFVEADRYSCAEIALRLDQDEFYRRRAKLNSSNSSG